MYSDISIRTMLFSSSNRFWASAFASSVLPTPVGPRKRNEPIGFEGSLIPALERRIASVTFSTASSWPTTLLWSSSARWSVFSRSPSVSLATGIPVHFEIILQISSSVTASWTRERSFDFTDSSSAASCFSSCGSLPYCNSAALLRSYFCCAWAICWWTCSISSRSLLKWSTDFFSLSHCAFMPANSSRRLESSCLSVSRRSCDKWSVSFFNAASSISSCIILRLSSSISAGMESISVFTSAHASSTRSIALSGRKRSEI